MRKVPDLFKINISIKAIRQIIDVTLGDRRLSNLITCFFIVLFVIGVSSNYLNSCGFDVILQGKTWTSAGESVKVPRCKTLYEVFILLINLI